MRRLHHRATAQAASTDAHPSGNAANVGAHRLKVRTLHHLGLDVGVADFVTDESAFITDIATVCHGRLLFLSTVFEG